MKIVFTHFPTERPAIRPRTRRFDDARASADELCTRLFGCTEIFFVIAIANEFLEGLRRVRPAFLDPIAPCHTRQELVHRRVTTRAKTVGLITPLITNTASRPYHGPAQRERRQSTDRRGRLRQHRKKSLLRHFRSLPGAICLPDAVGGEIDEQDRFLRAPTDARVFRFQRDRLHPHSHRGSHKA